MTPERYKLSIVIGTFNRLDQLKTLLEHIETRAIEDHEVIVVDGGSTDGTMEFLLDKAKEGKPNFVVVLDNNRDSEKNMKRTLQECYNMGFKLATGRYIVHLNDDCQLEEQGTPWPQNAIEFLEAEGNEEIGMLSLQIGEPKVVNGESQIDWRFSYDDILNSNLLFANHAIIERGFFESIGWWDEGFLFYAADNDCALKVRDNQRHVVGFEGGDRIIHLATADETREMNEKTAKLDFARLREKWQQKIGTLVQQEMQKEQKFRGLEQLDIGAPMQTIKPEGEEDESA